MKKSKKIILAKSAGFCWGVNRAFDKILDVTKKTDGRKKIYTYGPLIHNPEAVKMLEEKGVKVLDHIPEHLDGAIFIRTHGISPEERAKIKSLDTEIYDATCPDVGHIQGIVKKHIKRGYHIIIVGDKRHPEVKALLGFAEGKGVSIKSADEIEEVIPAEWDKICVVAQSTQKEEGFFGITEPLKKRHKECLIFNTICRSTALRQEEVRKMSQKVDAMLVVGGFNSANTNKLAQISRETGTPTFHIEDADGLNINEYNEFDVIGITAGASTPRWSIERVVRKFEEKGPVKVEEFHDDQLSS